MMKVKRFRAPTMKEALEIVKAELGEDAVILKSEKVPNKGFFDLMKKDIIEIVAAVDDDAAAATPAGNASVSSRQKSNLAYFRNQHAAVPGEQASAGTQQQTGSAFDSVLEKQMESGTDPDFRKSVNRDGAVQEKAAPPVRTRSAASAAGPGAPVSWTEEQPSEDVRRLREELVELRSLVHTLSAHINPARDLSIREFADLPAPFAAAMMHLLEQGVETHIARSLIEKTSRAVPVADNQNVKKIHTALQKQIAEMIPVAGPIKCRKGKTRVIAVAGPTGVGKTTTLAKLAANSKFVFEKNVSLISADTYRMSAIEHLNTFAGIAHLPISAVYSPSEIRASLAAQQDKDLIFIDTAGISPRDGKHLDELHTFMEAAEPDEIHLVLPANIKNIDLLEYIRRFSVLSPNRLVISKIDETVTPGSILNMAVEAGCPISYVTHGQTIPDDIELADSGNLARLIMKERRDGED